MPPPRILVSPKLGGVALFLFLLGTSLLFFHGQLKTSDEQLMAATTASIAERFTLVFDQEIHGQRFTGYGVGTPLTGLPAYYLDKLFTALGPLEGAAFNLVPLTNAVLFGLLGAMLAGLLDGQRRWGFFCANCESFDNAVDSMGRIQCNRCSNFHKAEEWDAAHE